MGVARRARNSVQFAQGQSGGEAFIPTQPGDVEFDRFDSQAQFGAASAEYVLFQNQRRAANVSARLRSQGVDPAQYPALVETEEDGFVRRGLSFGERALQFIDGPRQAVNLAIQDIIGGNAPAGRDNPNFGDYLNAFVGGVEDQAAFEEKTGLQPESGSLTLEMFGLEEADSGLGKVARGVATFGFEVLSDPLSYVTFGFSALGKRVALSTVDQYADNIVRRVLDDVGGDGLDAYARAVFDDVDNIVIQFGEESLKNLDSDNLGALARYLVRKDETVFEQFGKFRELVDGGSGFDAAVKAQAKQLKEFAEGAGLDARPFSEYLARTAQAVRKELLDDTNVTEFAIRNKVGTDIAVPLLARDFLSVPEAALETLPAFARGGARLSVPFTRSTLSRAIPIPGTVGLGKKLFGDRMRAGVARIRETGWGDSVARKLDNAANSVDSQRVAFKALQSGEWEPWQWSLLQQSLDDVGNALITQETVVALNAGKQVALDLADDSSVVADKLAADLVGDLSVEEIINSEVLARVESGLSKQRRAANVAVGMPGAAVDEFEEAIDDLAILIGETFDVYHQTLSNFAPEFAPRFIKNYSPQQIKNKAARNLLDELGKSGAAVSKKEIARLQAKSQFGGMIVSQLLNTLGHGGRVAAQFGSSSEMKSRLIGKANMFRLTNSTDVVGFNRMTLGRQGENVEDVLGLASEGGDLSAFQPSFLGAKELNDEIEPVLRDLAGKKGVRAPEDAFRPFNENVLESTVAYVNSMSEAISELASVEAMIAAGLAKKRTTGLSTQGAAEQVYIDLLENANSILAGRKAGETAVQSFTTDDIQSMIDAGVDTNVDQLNKLSTLVFDNSPQEFVALRGTPIDEKSSEGVFDSVADTLNFLHGQKGRDSVFDAAAANATTVHRLKGRATDVEDVVVAARGADGKPFAVIHSQIDSDGKLLSLDWGVQPAGAKAAGGDITAIFRSFEAVDTLLSVSGQKLDFATVSRLLDEVPMSEHGARLLRRYTISKLRMLDDTLLERIAEAPADLLRFQDNWESFVDATNEVLAFGSRRMGADGRPLPLAETENFELLATEKFKELVSDARRLAKETEIPGLDSTVFGNIREATTGLRETDNFVNPALFAIGGDAVEGLEFQKDIMVWMRQAARNSNTIWTPEGVAALKQNTNQVIKLWKTLVTITRPAFHIRNMVGGVWNNQIAGVRMQDYVAIRNVGVRLRNSMRGGKGFDDAVEAVVPKAEQKMWRSAFDEGVLTNTFTSAEFRNLTVAQKDLKRKAFGLVNPVSDNFLPARMGALFMEGSEDFLRMSAFRRWYDPDAGGRVAGEMATRIHFDYTDLTPLETKIKTIAPFFVWTRRNLPLQLTVMLERPELIQRYRAMLNSIEDQWSDVEQDRFPESTFYSAFAAGTGIVVNKDTPNWARVVVDPDLPIKDLLGIDLRPSEAWDWVSQMLGPQIGLPLDLNEQREFGDVNAPADMSVILKSLAAMGFYDTTAAGDARIPYLVRTLWETAFPFSREFLPPNDPRRQARRGIPEDANFLESAARNLGGSIGGGLGLKVQSPVDTRAATFDSSNEISRLVADLQLQGVLKDGG